MTDDLLESKTLGQAIKVAPTNLPILLLGPPGSGKTALAERIHRLSGRSGRFVALNCAAVPENLVESELFGSVPGAYNGAVLREGFVKAADKGTLFLDEIAELKLETQAKFLSVLEGKPFYRLGDSKTPMRSDFRLLCATMNDIRKLAREGKFREDLLARIDWFSMQLPHLRDRLDRLIVARKIVEARCVNDAKKADEINKCIRRLFDEPQAWPGNIRELVAFVEIAMTDLELAEEQVRRKWSSVQVPATETRARPITHATSQTLDDLEQYASLIRACTPVSTNPKTRPPLFKTDDGSRTLARLLLAKDPPAPVTRAEIKDALKLKDKRPVEDVVTQLARDGLVVNDIQSVVAIWPQATIRLGRLLKLPKTHLGFLPVPPDKPFLARTGDRFRLEVRTPTLRYVTIGISVHSWDGSAPGAQELPEPKILMRRQELEAKAEPKRIEFELEPPCGCVQLLVHLSPSSHWGVRMVDNSGAPDLVPTTSLELVRRRVLGPTHAGGWGNGWLAEFVIVQLDQSFDEES